MKKTNIGFGSQADEDGLSRMDRQQAATDIGKIVKMLALSTMMLEEPQSLDKESALYKYSEIIRNKTSQITSDIIGEEFTEFKDDEYSQYYTKSPKKLDKLADTAGEITAIFIDAIISSRYLDEKKIDILQEYLNQVLQSVDDFNKQVNNMHKLADITILDKDNNNKNTK